MKKTVLIVYLLVVALFAKPQTVTHVVFCWMDSTVNEQQIDSLIERTKKLNEIPGIIDLSVGRPLSSERPIVDDSFSFGIAMTFANSEDMKLYLIDERHTSFVNTFIKPKLSKILVYDIQGESK